LIAHALGASVVAVSDHEQEDVLYRVPAPPPPFPPVPPPGGPQMVYFERRIEEDGREHEDLMLRKVPRETAMRFRAAAGGRSLTYGQYLSALTALHEAARALADGGNDAVRAELERLGLGTVTV
jgi:hypothetical protein